MVKKFRIISIVKDFRISADGKVGDLRLKRRKRKEQRPLPSGFIPQDLEAGDQGNGAYR